MTQTIGIIGGGQLCLMLGEAIKDNNLTVNLITLDPTPECPAHPFVSKQIVGSIKDEEKIKELSSESTILTYESEWANAEALKKLEDGGVIVRPSASTLEVIQDKFLQFEFYKEKNLPTPACLKIESAEELQDAISKLGLPLMIKARRDSYDGKGNLIIKSEQDIEKVFSYFENRTIMAQQFIPFDLEVSIICVRDKAGNIATYPVCENIHGEEFNVLQTSIVPARISDEIASKAVKVAQDVMDAFSDIGTFGIELFISKDELYINEVAPRPHNTGHYTIEACASSQFEGHMLAVSGEKLKSSELKVKGVVMHNILGGPNQSGPYTIKYKGSLVKGTSEVEKGIFIHHYGKHKSKPYGKYGHVTVLINDTETMDELIKRAQLIANEIVIE